MAQDDDVLEIVEQATRSVVNINTVRVFQDVYYRVVPVKGMGSGFIYNSDGYILTNAHVVDGSERIGAVMGDGRVLEGRLVGACQSHDVAVVRVEGDGLAVAQIGDSDSLKMGQRVYAIGNPFGLEGGPTVTAGVISALDRSIHSTNGTFEKLVQTDAAINPGNSGGPLVDLQGRVIAVNTAIIPYAQGIGFAVPINVAKKCAEELIAHGTAVRPWLGVSGITINRDVAAYYDIPVEWGVLVLRVWAGSPAEKAGIVVGDVIQMLGGTRILSSDDLQKTVQDQQVGTRIDVRLIREGTRKWLVQAELERMP